jgi:outer membrane scaffolding protein for murein synthesis (MipA/OmpV family)
VLIENNIQRFCQLAVVAICLLASGSSFAQQEIVLEDELQPLWEAGAFGAVFRSPEYPAADQSQNNVLAAPYFIYRGETFRVGDGSIARAVAIDKSNYELDLSLAGSFNANSDDNIARQGMPDLDYIFELGPQLKLRLTHFEFEHHGKGELFLNLQTRAAFSTDFSGLDYRGLVLQPELAYRQKGWLSDKTALSISVSPTWASERLHDYFYQVDSEFVNSERQAFNARGGYLGTDLSIGASFNASHDVRIFLGGNIALHAGVANVDSPLFKSKSTYSFGVGLVWRLYESEEQVAGR